MPCTQTIHDYFSYFFRHSWPQLFGENELTAAHNVESLYGDKPADQLVFSLPLCTQAEECSTILAHNTDAPEGWRVLQCGGAPLPDRETLAEAAWAAPLLEKLREAQGGQNPALTRIPSGKNRVVVLTDTMPPEKVLDYLRAIGWPGHFPELEAFLDLLAPQMKVKSLRLQLTLAPQGVEPALRLHIESLFGWGRRLLERWLDFLQQQGLCLPEKAAGVLNWYDTPMQYRPTVQCNVAYFELLLPAGKPTQALCGLRLSQNPTRNNYDYFDAPATMNLELTTRCPLHCPQCYCDLTHGQDLDVNEALYWIEEAHRNSVYHVNLSGGETMVYPHLLTLIHACAVRGMQANIAISGYGITREVLQKLIATGVGGIFVSLNGSTKEIGSKTRDGYELAIHALELLRDMAFDGVHINWVMHSNNADDFANMITLCETYKVPALSVMVFKPDSSHQLPSAPTAAQLHAVAEIIRAYKGPVRFDIEGCFSQMRALVYQGFMGNLNQGLGRGCMAGTAAISINVNGKITPCRHLEIPEETRTILEYWHNSPTLQALRTAAHNPQEPCKSCNLQKNCLPCMAFNHKLHGKIAFGTQECPLEQERALL